ncbi:DUF6571 family protein [Streptomyces sp. NPDC051773]|uniref:WXG100 family type VII secretion target n=1 Tax=Streptomyces sp. NPDC051773 TaxID=3156682 RepID=UPI00343628B4
MLDYKILLDADFSELSQAVNKWSKLPEKFEKVGKQYWTTVEQGIWGSDWTGAAADAAREKMDRVEKQIDAAAAEASDVHRLLDSAYEVFIEAQRQLKKIKHSVEEDKYLSIKPDGVVWFDPPKDTPSDQVAFINKGYQETIQFYRTAIQNQVSAAQEADETLHWALSQDRNGRGKGFEANAFNSLKDAQKAREQADKDRKALTELAGLQRPYTLDEIKKIQGYLKKHEGDPFFAEKFATGLGAKGTLEFWTRIADRTQYGDDMTKESAKIQHSLGYTLGLASQSGSGAMERWEKDMIKLGGTRLDMTDTQIGMVTKGPYGFQVMSSLMRYGRYDDGFLNDYGTELLKFEKSHKDLPPKELWQPDGYETFLNFGKGTDHGMDPVAGYMEALGHNPEAAKAFFATDKWRGEGDWEKNLDPDLKYVLQDRKWPDVPNNQHSEDYDELGHAIEAATLGIPYDQPELGLNRDNETANVAEQVIKMIGQDNKFIEDRPGIGDSIAKMGAGYIDDLNWSASNFGNSATDQDLRNSAFGHHGEGHISLTHGSATTFLSIVAANEEGHGILSGAQQQYAVNALGAHPNPDAEAERILKTNSLMQGMLDQSRVGEIHGHYGEKTEEAERKLAEAAAWKEFWVGSTVGLGAAAVALPFGGAAVGAAAVAAFVVPEIVGVAGDAYMTDFGIDLDRELEEKKPDYTKQEKLTLGEFADRGAAHAVTPADAYIAANKLEGTAWATEVSESLRGHYNDGSDTIERITPTSG